MNHFFGSTILGRHTRLLRGTGYLSARLLVFLSIALTCYSPALSAATPPARIQFQRVLDKFDITIGTIESIVQDPQGYIWLGGENGLLRYDGIELKFIDHNDSAGYPVRNIFSLFVDSRGILWIATGTGLIRYHPEHERFERFNLRDNNNESIVSLHAIQMAELPSGELIVATRKGLAVINVASGAMKFLLHDDNNDNSLLSDNLWSVTVDSRGDVWAGGDKGVDRIQWNTGKIIHYRSQKTGNESIPSGLTYTIKEDNAGDIWVGTEGGLSRINPHTHAITVFKNDRYNENSLSGNSIRTVHQDAAGIFWIGTDQSGLNTYDPSKNRFQHYQTEAGDTKSLTSNVLRAIFEDRNGDLWLSTYPSGVHLFNRASAVSSIYKANAADPKSLSNNSILSITPTDNGNYWLGTDGGGLNYFDRENDRMVHYKHDPDKPNSISANAVMKTLIYSQGVLWAGTWGGGLNRFEKATNSFHRFVDVEEVRPGVTQSKNLNAPHIRVVYEDRRGNLWLGTQFGGLNKFDRKTELFTHYMPDPKVDNAILYTIIYCLLEDSQGRFWVGTQNSLELMDRRKETFRHFQKIEGDPTSLSNSVAYSIYEDSKQRVWIGTADGLNRLNDDGRTFQHFGKEHGLYNTIIRSIIEGPDGNIWLGTGNGISSLNPETGKINNYYKSTGWQTGNFNPGAVAKNEQGELIFGGDNGLSMINLSELKTNDTVPPIVITDFKLFTDSVKIGAADGLLPRAIDYTEAITLNHSQSMFSFAFSALNYRDSSQNKFAYRLQGFDDDWRNVGTQHHATFTSIVPGDYVFQVKGSNNDDVWNTTGTSIKIRILPPWWKTWWAYTLYSAAIFGVLAWILLHQRYKRRLVEEHNRKIEEQNRKLIALDKLKDDFIANTSHELRTPLNGIIGLADSLLEGAAGEVSQLMSMNLQMISTSGKRLAKLVNDILDFSKLKNQNIALKLAPVDLYELSLTVLNLFGRKMISSDIQIINKISSDTKPVLADEDRLQQILYNLVGNAIKFTHHGSVTLDCIDEGERLWLRVIDTGIGIPAHSLEKIFNSFEQLEDHRDRAYSGTGLGLAVTKQLVEAHGSLIKVESEDGKGSCFSFSLATTSSRPQFSGKSRSPAATRINVESDSDEDFSDLVEPSVLAANQPAIKPYSGKDLSNHAQFKILVVDDNPINRQVLINQLAMQQYSFAVANDGQSALSAVEDAIEDDEPFDLILLDIMMPQMSGYEVCRKLREKYDMEALPIIFLTAKNAIADLVSGFEVGANDFLTKPISIGELNSRIRTHLQLLDINRKLESMVEQRTNEVALAHKELKTLDQIVSIISQEIRIDRLLAVIFTQTKSLFPEISYIAFWKLDEAIDCFRLSHIDDSNLSDQKSELSGLMEREALEEIYIHRADTLSEDVYSCTESIQLPDLPKAASILSLAFRQNGVITSLLAMASVGSMSAFNGMQAVNYERLRSHIASALSKAKLVERLEHQCDELEQMSLTDPLTGLKNRRFLTKYIDHDISLLQRKQFHRQQKNENDQCVIETDFIFFIMDIDHFKLTNDEFGHAGGDRVLAEIKTILEPVFRTSDYRIRWGGEEFLIVARFCDREHAGMKAEQLRAAMEAFPFPIEEGKTIHKTCSIGYACYPFCPSDSKALSWTQVIALADLALYTVKNSQRNGWLGINNNRDEIVPDLFKNVMEDPDQAVFEGLITTSSNIAEVLWPK